jgi:hypothetical protein
MSRRPSAINHRLLAVQPVNHPVGFEKHLAVLVDAHGQQLFGSAAALGQLGQALRHVHELVQQSVGVGHAVVFGNVVKKGLQVLLSPLGQHHFIHDGSRGHG